MAIVLSKVAFWCCVGLFVYTFLGYPALSWMLAALRRKRRVNEQPVEARVTVIVAAHNEDTVIANRLANITGMVFSPMKVEIIVVSDGSTDRTEEIVSAWADAGVRLLALPRGGRALAHNRAVSVATGDILVFTDAQTSFQKDLLSKILRPFSDAQVGCVVGRLVYVTERQTLAEDTGLYWKYETRLREWESDAGLLTVGSGCCMAVRRELFRTLHPDEDVDDAIPLDLLFQGFRVVCAMDAVAFDVAPCTPRDEIRARARMTVLSLTAVIRRRSLLNPFRFPLAALSLFSHRILRYLTPIFAIGALLSSALLTGHALYGVAFLVQALFYTFSVLGWVTERRGLSMPIFRMPLSFCLWNIGFAIGLIRVLRGQTVTTYVPA